MKKDDEYFLEVMAQFREEPMEDGILFQSKQTAYSANRFTQDLAGEDQKWDEFVRNLSVTACAEVAKKLEGIRDQLLESFDKLIEEGKMETEGKLRVAMGMLFLIDTIKLKGGQYQVSPELVQVADGFIESLSIYQGLIWKERE